MADDIKQLLDEMYGLIVCKKKNNERAVASHRRRQTVGHCCFPIIDESHSLYKQNWLSFWVLV